MSFVVRVFFAFFLILTTTLTTAIAQEQSRRIELTQDGDYFGFDLRTEKDVTLDECQAICIEDKVCKAFTYNKKASWCFLKSDRGQFNPFAGSVAGKIVTASAEPDIGPVTTRSFVSGYEGEAQGYRNNLVAAAPKTGPGVDEVIATAERALLAGDLRAAYQNFGTAAALSPDDSNLWTQLSRTAMSVSPNDGESGSLQQAVLAGAVNGYLTSRTTKSRAAALDVLAKALDQRNDPRRALNAYKASLELVNSKDVEAAYKDLRARKGFRVVEHSVDTASATPRICVQFSETLADTDIDFASYILLDGAPAKSVTRDSQQLCIDDVGYGKRYSVTVRQGLPSTVDEVIESPVNLSVFVRDRDTYVRLDGENFVLPSTARRGIPVVSVNATNADVKVYRVNDRSLPSLLLGSQFLSQLDGYGIERVSNELGEPVWS
ncbi:MAG: PAN domain-containing protein, partial [Rhizobiaceae bacterium]